MTDKQLNHHVRQEYCTTRPQYRQGNKLTAVKVYTSANESSHLLVFGVPKVNLHEEVKRTFLKHGPLVIVICITEEMVQKIELERFTDAYYVKYLKLEHARRAKKFLDAREFYGGILHISYAPERETKDELRAKMSKRKMEVKYRLRMYEKHKNALRRQTGSKD